MQSLYFLLFFLGAAFALVDFPELPNEIDGIVDPKTNETDPEACNGNEKNCRPHHHHHFTPPFLKKVSPRARREFYRIVYNKDTTRNQKKQQLEEWAKKQGDDIVHDLHDFEGAIHKFLEKVHNGMVATVKAIPDAYTQVHDILANRDITPRQAWEKLVALKLDPVVARSLRAIYFFVIHQGRPEMEDFHLVPSIGFDHASVIKEDLTKTNLPF